MNCSSRVEALLEELGISRDLVERRRLRICDEARDLVVVEVGEDGRQHLLIPAAADAWRRLRVASRSDGVSLAIASAFRSIDRQAEIVQRKLDRGLSVDDILRVSAPPGYSEHHSGRAVDVATPGSPPLQPEFDQTEAFRWLAKHAASFHFEMSYPAGNPEGYMYEPWHWCFRKAD